MLLLFGAVAFFIASIALSLARLKRERNALRIGAKSCEYWGLLLGLAALIWHSANRRSWIPLEDNFEALTALGLLIAGFVIYMQHARPIPGIDWFLIPVAILMLLSAAFFGRVRPDAYRPDSLWSWTHRLTSYGGAVAFAIAAAVGSMYLIVAARLRKKSALPGPNLGSLERLEKVTQIAAKLGFALLTLGIITGLIREIHSGPQTQLGPNWMTSPKVILAFCVWITYALALHTPISPGVRGRRSAMLSIVGFVLMFGTIVAVQFMPGAK
jgi:ABC-type transport system involved in cytochrome c biogenesis permease subunit